MTTPKRYSYRHATAEVSVYEFGRSSIRLPRSRQQFGLSSYFRSNTSRGLASARQLGKSFFRQGSPELPSSQVRQKRAGRTRQVRSRGGTDSPNPFHPHPEKQISAPVLRLVIQLFPLLSFSSPRRGPPDRPCLPAPARASR